MSLMLTVPKAKNVLLADVDVDVVRSPHRHRCASLVRSRGLAFQSTGARSVPTLIRRGVDYVLRLPMGII